MSLRKRRYDPTSINPPVLPEERDCGGGGVGRRLLALVRSLEKSDGICSSNKKQKDQRKRHPESSTGDCDDSDIDDDRLEEAVDLMGKLVAACARRGLTGGNRDVAECVLQHRRQQQHASSSSSSRPSKKARKQQSKNATKTSDLSMYDGTEDVDGHQKPAATATTVDVNFIVSAVLRILDGGGGGGGGNRTNGVSDAAAASDGGDADLGGDWDDDRRLLIVLAADLITAAGEFLLRNSTSVCANAEYELLAVPGKQLLSGLERTVRGLLQHACHPGESGGNEISDTDDDDDEYTAALVSSLRAASMLVYLFGTRLSRGYATILTGLRDAAWQALRGGDDRVTYSAAVFLSYLPLTGCNAVCSISSSSPSVSPSELWNVSFKDTVAAVQVVLSAVAPISGKRPSSGIESSLSAIASDYTNVVIRDCTDSIRNANTEEARVNLFLQLMNGLVALAVCLLEGPSLPPTTSIPPLISAEIDINSTLDAVETMLAFSVAAEVVYHGTKKRLRQEPVDNGCLSPSALVGKVANVVKLYGLNLFGSLLESIGGQALLPFASRIRKVSSACLLSSSSTSVRCALDPTSMVQSDKKRQRWLHTSISLRATSVRVFEKCILLFGIVQGSASPSSFGSPSQSDAERAVSLVGGCIIELIVEANGDASADWGSSSEREDLLVAAANCLNASMVSGGELIPHQLRALVDSVANVCLVAIVEDNPAVAASAVKIALLSFGTACLSTPWPDGAASAIGGILHAASCKCERNSDSVVVLTASTSIRAGDVSSTPRVPALSVITRSGSSRGDSASSQFLSIESLIERLAVTRREVISHKTESLGQPHAATSQAEDERGKNIPTEHDTSHTAKLDVKNERNQPHKNETSPAASRAAHEDKISETPSTTTESQIDDSGRADGAKLNASPVDAKPTPKANPRPPKEQDRDDDSDEDFPMIVDCDPDNGDEDSEG